MNRDHLIEQIERIAAIHISGNRQPCMSGDPRDRLSPLQRRNLSDLANNILDVVEPMLRSDEREKCARIARGQLPMDVHPDSPYYGFGRRQANDFERGIEKGRELAAKDIRR